MMSKQRPTARRPTPRLGLLPPIVHLGGAAPPSILSRAVPPPTIPTCVGWIGRDSIPQPDSLVIGSCRQRVAIGCPGNARNSCHVPNKRVDILAGFGVPDFGGAICGGGGDPSSVGGDADLADGGGVAAKCSSFLVVGCYGLACRVRR